MPLHGHDGPPPTRNPLVMFQSGFEARFERFRAGYRNLLALALHHRAVFIVRLSGLRGWRRSCWCRFSGATSFRRSMPARSCCMPARRSARGSRTPPTGSPTSRRRSAASSRRSEIATIVDNVGMPVSGINMTYNNTGTIGSQDGDI